MRRKLLFVFNLKSGKGLIRTRLADILDLFTRSGYEVTAHSTQSAEDAAECVRRYASEMDLLVCGGGDGTLDVVVKALMETRPELPVGYIPCGSTNDFGTSIGISKNLLEAAQDIIGGTIFPCDVGLFNNTAFVYVAAFGMFTNVSYETDQNLKNTLGHIAYLLEAGKQLFNIPSCHVRADIDGKVIEGNFAYGMITNARSVGGIKNITGSHVDLSDGLFEVTLVHTPVNALEMSEIISALLTGTESSSQVKKFKAKRIVIESAAPVRWTLDGEYGDSHKKVVIENKQRVLRLLLNPKRVIEEN